MRGVSWIEQAAEMLVGLVVSPATERAHTAGDLRGRQEEVDPERQADPLDLSGEPFHILGVSSKGRDLGLHHLRPGFPEWLRRFRREGLSLLGGRDREGPVGDVAGRPPLQDEHPGEMSQSSPRTKPGGGARERRRRRRERADDRGGRPEQSRRFRIRVRIYPRTRDGGNDLSSTLDRGRVGDDREQPQVILDRAESGGGLEHRGAGLFVRSRPVAPLGDEPCEVDREVPVAELAACSVGDGDEWTDLHGTEDPLRDHFPDPGRAASFELSEPETLAQLQEPTHQTASTELEGELGGSIKRRALSRGSRESSAARSSPATAAAIAPRRSARRAAASSSLATSSSVPTIDAARCHARRSG